ncbi:transglutaminase family protein [Synechococcus sp. CS-1328]|uniref:transglutaminase family protein n=1 Tax=Synechococcus sp. CS-1328 TaxID=2847976 RepID=UPI00223AAC1A|nr:transglutaminase family protein [Synechococcus sp. CS-1328]MCT0223750.1 transglutaminase family protein [Synechococcus sp. CS-1328]
MSQPPVHHLSSVHAADAAGTQPRPPAAAAVAEARLRAAGIHLTLGGEPTYVPLEPEGAEWSVCADGPTKLPIAQRLARELQQQVWPGSTLLYCPGKRYEGEVNPRWALRLITGLDGSPPPVRWPEPCQPGELGNPLTAAQATAWLADLGTRLGVELHPVELSDPLDPLRRVWAVPLTIDDASPPEDRDPAQPAWLAVPWPLAEEHRQLSGAPGPAGLRLPLEHFPDHAPRQVLTLEVVEPDGVEETGSWDLFLPPLLSDPLELLLQAVADGLADSVQGAPLAAPALSGVLPSDGPGRWQVLGLTADPGVLEINLPVCHSWAEYDGWLRRLEKACATVGLRSWKSAAGGRQESTGGGNHLLWGGASLEQNPFFGRPAWLSGILRYWQHHPSLGYLFSGTCVGPASQAPRPDEAIGSLFDLELAYSCIEQSDAGNTDGQPDASADRRSLIGETLRHLHADRSGNNHRSEISFDKFWNPGAPAGCLGLIEFRALESLPRVEWSSAIALLWSSLAAHLLEPRHRPEQLRPWGPELHDRLLLPSQLWADLDAVLAALADDGLGLNPTPFQELWEWRFPSLLDWQDGAAWLEIRPALEPWPLICDTPVEGGFTSRFVDASLRRLEIRASGSFRDHHHLRLNGRLLPLAPLAAGGEEPPLAVRYRHHRLYPCMHPAIEPHMPLELSIEQHSPNAEGNLNTVARFCLNDDATSFKPIIRSGWVGEGDAPPWTLPADDLCTVDLRLP